jgi:hypothetical protein
VCVGWALRATVSRLASYGIGIFSMHASSWIIGMATILIKTLVDHVVVH